MRSISYRLSNDYPSISYASCTISIVFFLNLFPVIKIFFQKWFLTIYNNSQIGIELLHVEN